MEDSDNFGFFVQGLCLYGFGSFWMFLNVFEGFCRFVDGFWKLRWLGFLEHVGVFLDKL